MSNRHRNEKRDRNLREWTRIARVWRWAERIEAELCGPQTNLRSVLDPKWGYRMVKKGSYEC